MHSRYLLWMIACATSLTWAATLLGRFGAENWFFDLFANFHMQYLLGAACIAAVSLSVRSRILSTISIALIILNGAIIASDYKFSTDDVRGPTITIVNWNVFYENEHIDEAVEFLERTSADIVVLAEPTEAWRRGLDALTSLYPYRLDNPTCDDVGCAMTMMSKLPWRSVQTEKFVADTPPVIWAMFDATDDYPAFNVIALHARKAIDADGASRQRAQTEAVGKLTGTLQRPVLLLGDLNAVPTSAAFKRLLAATGLRPGNRNFTASWPSPLGPFGISIDHILVSENIAVKTVYGPSLGSDHRALVSSIGFQP